MTHKIYSKQQDQLAGSARTPGAKPYMDEACIPIPIELKCNWTQKKKKPTSKPLWYKNYTRNTKKHKI